MSGEDQFLKYKRSAEIAQLLEENKAYISKKQRTRLQKRGKNALINEDNEGKVTDELCPLCQSEKAVFYHYGHETDRFYYKCVKCSLIFVLRSSYLSEFEEAKRYEMHDNDIKQPGYRTFLNRCVVPLHEALKSTQEEWDNSADEELKKISRDGMDFGCGPGPSISILMGELGYKVVNFDPQFVPDPENPPTKPHVVPDSLATIDTGKETPVIQSIDVLYAQPSLQRKYRFITCTEVIEHVKDPMVVWKKLFDLVAPGGVVAMMTGVVNNEEMFKGWHYHRDPTHICFYHKDTLNYVESLFPWKMSRPDKQVILFTKNKDVEVETPNEKEEK